MRNFLLNSFLFLSLSLLFFACGKAEKEAQKTEIEVVAPTPVQLQAVSEEFNRTALFLAGLPQVDSNYYAQIEKKSFLDRAQNPNG